MAWRERVSVGVGEEEGGVWVVVGVFASPPPLQRRHLVTILALDGEVEVRAARVVVEVSRVLWRVLGGGVR